MSDYSPALGRVEQAYQKYRLAVAVLGTVAVVAGLIILFWPGIVMNVIVTVVGAFAIVAGAVYLGIGIFSKNLSGGAKGLRIALGITLIALGILVFVFNVTAANVVVWVIAITVGAGWIVEGAVTLMGAVKAKNTNAWLLVYAVVAILAGIAVALSPLRGGGEDLLKWLFGLSFVILGVAQITRSITLGKASPAATEIIEVEID
mgnify:CR=1 FL=1